MLKTVTFGLLIFPLFLLVSAGGNGFPRCNCDDEEGLWSIESILQYQKVSDFLIAIAYFSIPIELLYFLSCSNVPFKWVLFQFIAFIVLCGMTHLLNGWTYNVHPFQLMLALTIFKFLTALVSCATAITLITLIPLLLKVKVRELFLKKKAWELDQEVGMMKKQKEASWHVRMLTHEIRKTLNRHTILYTTLIELSKTLDLKNCAVWMPNEGRTVMNLTHELNERKSSESSRLSIPISDPDVSEIEGSEGVKILRSDSALGLASSGWSDEPGAVAAIRMQMLRVSDFKGGTPELIQACYAILVLVLPGGNSRVWSFHELEIVEVVADQVAVALSHAAVLEESQLMTEKLEEQNRALQQARKDAMMASQARNSFQKVMSKGMRRPMHSISGLLSMIQQGNIGDGQRLVVDAMTKTSSVLSTLINDVMEISATGNGRFSLELRPFRLHSMIKEAACLAKCLCVSRDFDFAIEIDNSLPDFVLGDERRIFQVLLHMVGNLLNSWDSGGYVNFQVTTVSGNQTRNDQRRPVWRPNSFDGYASVKFEIAIKNGGSQDSSISSLPLSSRKHNSEGIESVLGFSVCKKLVQMMQGNIRVVPNSRGLPQIMTLVLRFHLQPCLGGSIFEPEGSTDHPLSNSLFRGLQVILADDDGVNRLVTRKLLEKLGCNVSAVSSGFECLNALSTGTSFQIVLLDLHMPEMDGFEVAMRIRKFGSGSRPLIIALTASADENVGEKCLQVGMNGIIRKPVLLKGMADEFCRVLKQLSKGV
ncbi:Signal transduction response regulator [Macleaya cordata]|uniref:Ethylene receptor n=1 Tax=Macleaya cordata TaxID=56857 RepID=A0A200PWA3_MACCD|nr:Signal transduction response regulator [Macleaya cordata]